MKSFTFSMDERMEATLDELASASGQRTRAGVLRLAIATLNAFVQGVRSGYHVAFVDSNDRVHRIIMFPELEHLRDENRPREVAAAAK